MTVAILVMDGPAEVQMTKPRKALADVGIASRADGYRRALQ